MDNTMYMSCAEGQSNLQIAYLTKWQLPWRRGPTFYWGVQEPLQENFEIWVRKSPRKIPGWIVLVCENCSVNEKVYIKEIKIKIVLRGFLSVFFFKFYI